MKWFYVEPIRGSRNHAYVDGSHRMTAGRHQGRDPYWVGYSGVWSSDADLCVLAQYAKKTGLKRWSVQPIRDAWMATG